MKKRTVNYKQNCENGNQAKDVSPKSSFVNNSGNYKIGIEVKQCCPNYILGGYDIAK